MEARKVENESTSLHCLLNEQCSSSVHQCEKCMETQPPKTVFVQQFVVPADSRHAHRRHAYDVGAPMPEDSPSVVSARQQGAASIAKWVQECNMLKTSTPLSNPADLFDLDYALGGYIAKINDTMIGSQVFTNQSVLKPDQEYVSVGQII